MLSNRRDEPWFAGEVVAGFVVEDTGKLVADAVTVGGVIDGTLAATAEVPNMDPTTLECVGLDALLMLLHI